MQRPTRRRSSEEETAAKTLSSQRHCWGQGGRNNQNLSGNYKIVKLCPLCLPDYDTSATRVCSSVRTPEHCSTTEMGKISCIKAPNWWSAKGNQKCATHRQGAREGATENYGLWLKSTHVEEGEAKWNAGSVEAVCPGWTQEMKRIRWAKMSTTERGEKASRCWGMLREPWEDGLMLDRPQTDPLLLFSSESSKINAEKAIISTYKF